MAPLPGLHTESLVDAEAQLAVLCRLLPGTIVPPTLALLEVTCRKAVAHSASHIRLPGRDAILDCSAAY